MRKLLLRLLRIEPGVDLLPYLLPALRDVITFGGLGCACYGISQVYPPAAWVVGGVALFWLGVKES